MGYFFDYLNIHQKDVEKRFEILTRKANALEYNRKSRAQIPKNKSSLNMNIKEVKIWSF
jgi:hypothetical protein